MAIREAKAKGFAGLVNITDPANTALPDWPLDVANNILIDDRKRIRQRPGFAQIDDADDVYATRDQSRRFVILAGALYESPSDGVKGLLAQVGDGPYYWCEFGSAVFLMGAETRLCIQPNRVIPWGVPTPSPPVLSETTGSLPTATYYVTATSVVNGIESAAPLPVAITASGGINIEIFGPCVVYVSDPDGIPKTVRRLGDFSSAQTISYTELRRPGTLCRSVNMDPPPMGDHIAKWNGRVWVCVYQPSSDSTAIIPSEPMSPHIFDFTAPNFFQVPGRVVVLADSPSGLVVGTETMTWAVVLAEDGSAFIQMIADYGCVSGASVDWTTDGKALFMTKRGPAAGLPYELLATQFSFPQSSVCAGVLFQRNGASHYVVSVDDAAPYNAHPRQQPTTVAHGLTKD